MSLGMSLTKATWKFSEKGFSVFINCVHKILTGLLLALSLCSGFLYTVVILQTVIQGILKLFVFKSFVSKVFKFWKTEVRAFLYAARNLSTCSFFWAQVFHNFQNIASETHLKENFLFIRNFCIILRMLGLFGKWTIIGILLAVLLGTQS